MRQEEIDTNKTLAEKHTQLCHYWQYKLRADLPGLILIDKQNGLTEDAGLYTRSLDTLQMLVELLDLETVTKFGEELIRLSQRTLVPPMRFGANVRSGILAEIIRNKH